MDVESYDSLLLRVKESLAFSSISKEIFLESHFSSALLDCNSCISLSLDLVTKQLEETNIHINKICGYLQDAITLLQMLSVFIKNVIESTAMACCNMKPFPVSTGNIILTVFMHCKDSECIYGNYLKSVEIQLKDLFRTCHELQLTYLMTMEKHFIFDLTEKEQQEILIESLNINMRIAEIVQALDIKTMAEQWKAYTVLCEKYSNFLQDKNIYNKCTQLCISTISENIKTAMEASPDNKNIQRSLKVANFTIKILLRVSNVFKNAVSNNYKDVVDLLIYIYLHSPAYIQAEKSNEFCNLIQTTIVSPTDSLCSVLLQNEVFIDHIYKINVKELPADSLLGYTILITSLITAILQKKEDQITSLVKRKLVDCVYRILPLGHYWFNMGLKFPSSDSSGSVIHFNLYEHLLTHTIALAGTFTPEQYTELERYMYGAILGTDCYSALFSANLWAMLARISNDELASTTILYLIRTYQVLEKHNFFHNSPQELYICCTIGALFEIVSDEEKGKIWQKYNPQSNIWTFLGVCQLPDDGLRRNTEDIVIENMKSSFHECFDCPDVTEKGINNLIQSIKLTATCTLENHNEVENYVVKLWSKVCNQNEQHFQLENGVSSDAVWFFEYLEALVSLTECTELSNTNSVKILHCMSTVIRGRSMELVILLFNLFCALTFNECDDEHQDVIESIFKETLKEIKRNASRDIMSHIQNILFNYRDHHRFHKFTSTIFFEDLVSRLVWKQCCDSRCNPNNALWKRSLAKAAHNEFTHKCVTKLVVNAIEPLQIKMKNTNSNFDLGDFMFDDNYTEGPPKKKAKFDDNTATSVLIEKLESDTLLLCQVERKILTDDFKKRINNVINKLSNVLQ